MRIKVIACDVLNREVCSVASRSSRCVDVSFLPQGLHEAPHALKDRLTEEIAEAESGKRYNAFTESLRYDFIVLAYGLCSNAVVGLSAAATPLVVPRAHDCVTVLLGSKERYRSYFDAHRGVYWYSPGWIERSLQPGKERYDKAYAAYLEKYGADNAAYLMETEQGWFKEYRYAAFVDWNFPLADEYRAYTKECAEYLGWSYDEIRGDPAMLERILDGDFRNNEVIVVPGKADRRHERRKRNRLRITPTFSGTSREQIAKRYCRCTELPSRSETRRLLKTLLTALHYGLRLKKRSLP